MMVTKPNNIEAWAAIEEVCNESAVAVSMPHNTPFKTKLYNSGAMNHMSPFCEKFTSYWEIPLQAIITADKQVFYTIGIGDLKIEVPHGKSFTSVILREALHAPDMAMMIVLILYIMKLGNSVTFKKDLCTIKNAQGKMISTIRASASGLYKVKHHMTALAIVTNKCVMLFILHCHLGHVSINTLHSLI
jgi:hypothetical protein